MRKIFNHLPLFTYSANYSFVLHKNKALFDIPLNMYENGKVPFNIKDIQSIDFINSSIKIIFKIPDQDVLLLQNKSPRVIE